MNAICVTCGTQFAETSEHPASCHICQEERQYVGFDGQQWTTLEQLQSDHQAKWQEEEPNLSSLTIQPHFAIGQRAFLVQTPAGNVLWDCLSLIDDHLASRIYFLGGIQAICISHPHFYTSMVEWSRAFNGAPIYIHADDRQWVSRPDDAIHFWSGESMNVLGQLTMIRCGGHFEGSSVLHWPEGAEGRGVLLSGDTIQVVSDRRWVSFMRSYPNLIPLNAAAVQNIVKAVEPFAFDRVYAGFPKMTVNGDGKGAVARSAERYVRAINR